MNDHSQDRRRILAWLGAAALAPLAATPALADDRGVTPAMTEGPFYPRSFPMDSDADLTRVAGHARRASGTALEVSGRVVDRSGRPRSGARVEIWQCDARGQYHHVGEPEASLDPDFQGFGAVVTDADGRLYRHLGRDAKLVTMKLASVGNGLAGSFDIVLGQS